MKVSNIQKKSESFTRKNRRLVAGIILGIFIGIALLTSLQNGGFIDNLLNRGDSRIERDVRDLVLIDNETPLSILTISDGSILKEINEDIFENAQNGDKLIIFSNKGIIYRPESNQIVNIVTLNL